MLDALDETIKAVLREIGGLNADEVDVAFEAPDREWAGRISKPTVNCYLYDIRENLRLRGTGWVRGDGPPDGNGASKRRPPRRYDLSYVCTAWTNDIEDEHRLLWQVLAAMIRCPEIPKHLLQGSLADLPMPVITEVAQPDGLLRDPADVWSALDNRIRPSVNVVVTLPLHDSDPFLAPLVLTRRLRFDEPGRPIELIQIAGRVTDVDGAPVAGAVVQIKGHAFSTVSSSEGRFAISGVPEGTLTLTAEVDGRAVTRDVEVPGANYDLTFGGMALAAAADDAGPAGSRPKAGRERNR